MQTLTSVFSEPSHHKPLILESPEATSQMGEALARAALQRHPGALLLYGSLGAGKTTLCRALVSALPGGDEAEIGSPSFTICNIYSTQPVVHHFDLYRLLPGNSDESLDESLECDTVLTIVEWPEHINPRDLPGDGLALRLTHGFSDLERRVEFSPLGPLGSEYLGHVLSYYRHL